LGPSNLIDPENDEEMSAIYHYKEPFSAECRAFGRLHEADHEELAVRCFGYVLLDEEHERALMDRFSDLELDFDGNGDGDGQGRDFRGRFLGRDGRPPPLRGVIKAFGQSDEPLRARAATRLLRDVVRLQQLGIIRVDVAHRQIINGKLSDFSTAITTPHYVINPELNPHIGPEWVSILEFGTFQYSISDYWDFDEMVRTWNDEHKDRKDQVSIHAFPGGNGSQIHYNLRNRPSWTRVYTFVDTRLYDWRNSGTADAGTGAADAGTGAADAGTGATQAAGIRRSGRKGKGSSPGKPKGAISTTRQRLDARPPRWYYDCDSDVAASLRGVNFSGIQPAFEYKDGLLFPHKFGSYW
jgi:hypothetical protein